MYIFVDYDNIPKEVRRWGFEHVVRRVIQSIEPLLPVSDQSLDVRLYGGWFEGNSLTREGQRLQAEIRAASPMAISRSDQTRLGIARIELARSLLADPAMTITHTFRRKGAPAGLQCERRPWLNCADGSVCPLAALEEFLSTDVCPSARCGVGPPDVFFKQEQKIVDTMLVADVLEASRNSESTIALVSSDDDVWPAVHSAVFWGRTVFHVRTRATTAPLQMYRRLPRDRYREVSLN